MTTCPTNTVLRHRETADSTEGSFRYQSHAITLTDFPLVEIMPPASQDIAIRKIRPKDHQAYDTETERPL
jgi:hypothetical protein